MDYNAYLAANPDVAAAVARGEMTAEQHYQNYGQHEGRALDGSNSGARTNYWDSASWQAQPGNAGGTNATGIKPGSFKPTAGVADNASFYRVPVEFEGQQFTVGLNAQQWENVQNQVKGGMSFNEAALRNAGDGIGTEVFMPEESGYLPYGIDVATGGRINSHGGGSTGGGSSGGSATGGGNTPGTTIPGGGGTPGNGTPIAPGTQITPTDPSTSSAPMGMSAFWQNLQKTSPEQAAQIAKLPASEQTRALVQAYRQMMQSRNGTGLLDMLNKRRQPDTSAAFAQGFNAQ
jgi:hypothetical protein